MNENHSAGISPRTWALPLALLAGVSLVWLFVVRTENGGKLLPFLDVLSWASVHAFFLFVAATMQRYYHTSRVFTLPNLSSTILFTALALFGYLGLTRSYAAWDPVYTQFVYDFMPLRAMASFLFLLLTTAIFWIDQQKVREQKIQAFAVEKEREAIRIELNTLQQQFKPHFLFNSLNSINALTLINPEEARRMVHLLSDFMRAAVRENQSELVPYSQELRHIQLYTEIEKVRFGNRLTVNFETEDGAEEALLPSLILQPLIENAVKYGLYGHTEAVTITIAAQLADHHLVISISNPYDADSTPDNLGTGFGLPSVEKKMMILYQQANLVKIDRSNENFTVTLTVPQS